ncbi:hypothetical protein Cadr_000017377 [Camelus dromedarius]|uniref:Uncharacterized protein n=1 Tax=Camelus dromedarius TaxID=9838 RepID=A0A5N4DG30_CAMDR|nr:hypothetical protein Cadr_000017377 [Camelus dromedarius]
MWTEGLFENALPSSTPEETDRRKDRNPTAQNQGKHHPCRMKTLVSLRPPNPSCPGPDSAEMGQRQDYESLQQAPGAILTLHILFYKRPGPLASRESELMLVSKWTAVSSQPGRPQRRRAVSQPRYRLPLGAFLLTSSPRQEVQKEGNGPVHQQPLRGTDSSERSLRQCLWRFQQGRSLESGGTPGRVPCPWDPSSGQTNFSRTEMLIWAEMGCDKRHDPRQTGLRLSTTKGAVFHETCGADPRVTHCVSPCPCHPDGSLRLLGADAWTAVTSPETLSGTASRVSMGQNAKHFTRYKTRRDLWVRAQNPGAGMALKSMWPITYIWRSGHQLFPTEPPQGRARCATGSAAPNRPSPLMQCLSHGPCKLSDDKHLGSKQRGEEKRVQNDAFHQQRRQVDAEPPGPRVTASLAACPPAQHPTSGFQAHNVVTSNVLSRYKGGRRPSRRLISSYPSQKPAGPAQRLRPRAPAGKAVPSYRRQRTGSPPPPAPLTIRRRPKGSLLTFTPFESKQGPRQALSWTKCSQRLTGKPARNHCWLFIHLPVGGARSKNVLCVGLPLRQLSWVCQDGGRFKSHIRGHQDTGRDLTTPEASSTGHSSAEGWALGEGQEGRTRGHKQGLRTNLAPSPPGRTVGFTSIPWMGSAKRGEWGTPLGDEPQWLMEVLRAEASGSGENSSSSEVTKPDWNDTPSPNEHCLCQKNTRPSFSPNAAVFSPDTLGPALLEEQEKRAGRVHSAAREKRWGGVAEPPLKFQVPRGHFLLPSHFSRPTAKQIAPYPGCHVQVAGPGPPVTAALWCPTSTEDDSTPRGHVDPKASGCPLQAVDQIRQAGGCVCRRTPVCHMIAARTAALTSHFPWMLTEEIKKLSEEAAGYHFHHASGCPEGRDVAVQPGNCICRLPPPPPNGHSSQARHQSEGPQWTPVGQDVTEPDSDSNKPQRPSSRLLLLTCPGSAVKAPSLPSSLPDPHTPAGVSRPASQALPQQGCIQGDRVAGVTARSPRAQALGGSRPPCRQQGLCVPRLAGLSGRARAFQPAHSCLSGVITFAASSASFRVYCILEAFPSTSLTRCFSPEKTLESRRLHGGTRRQGGEKASPAITRQPDGRTPPNASQGGGRPTAPLGETRLLGWLSASLWTNQLTFQGLSRYQCEKPPRILPFLVSPERDARRARGDRPLLGQLPLRGRGGISTEQRVK